MSDQTLSMFSLAIAILSLALSGATMWLTMVHRGAIRMTRPSVIFFGPDSTPEQAPKVFLRALLYSTSSRGQYIENAFIRLRYQDAVKTFSIWVLGDPDLARGSGLYVSPEGITCNHHFLLQQGGSCEFLPGDCKIELYVIVVGSSQPRLLATWNIALTEEQAHALKSRENGVYFDWDPDVGQYLSHVDKLPSPAELLARQLASGRTPFRS